MKIKCKLAFHITLDVNVSTRNVYVNCIYVCRYIYKLKKYIYNSIYISTCNVNVVLYEKPALSLALCVKF